MKPVILCLCLAVSAGCLEEHAYRVRDSALTTDEVIRLTQTGLTADTVREMIHADGVRRRPTSDQIVAMKTAGVDESVIRAMLKAPVRSIEVVERTYIYDDPCWCYYRHPADDLFFWTGVGILVGYALHHH